MNVLPRGGYPAQRPASIYPPNATRNRTATRFSGLQQDTVHLDHKPAGQQASAKVVPAAAQAVREDIYSLANPLTSTVLSNEKIADDTHKITFQVDDTLQWEPGQAIMVKCPDTILNNTGDGPHTAAYSIANHYEPGNKTLELLVKRLKKPEADGSTYRGRCSNYLCDLAKGDTVQVIGPFGNTFLMPDLPHANLLMICTGTGSAPMRAMTERRRRLRGERDGRLMLFFGTADNNVHPSNTYRVVDALIRANKRFDFILLPGQRHGYTTMGDYVFWRRIDYFAEHLLGARPSGIDITELERERQIKR